MSALFLAPHNLGDDEALFGSFTILREQAEVVVVLESHVQGSRGGPAADERAQETIEAMVFLGADWRTTTWTFRDDAPDWDGVEKQMLAYDRGVYYQRVYAPAVEEGGHEHHNRVGELADQVYGDRVTHYLTYTNGRARSTSDREVEYEPDWIALKLRALACYRSQHRLWACAHHFLAPQLEYYTPASENRGR